MKKILSPIQSIEKETINYYLRSMFMHFIKSHLEWLTFLTGLILLALMNPATSGISFCLFDLVGFEFCPGKGLGHSIAYTFRGDLTAAVNAHFAGPFAVLILSLRIIHLWKNLLLQSKPIRTKNGKSN